jgi:isoleucyl-tRNA synthetase
VDENGRKLSKSDGKPQTADDYVKKYGADLIRLWVASEDFRQDITLSDNIFEHVAAAYRGLRNTLYYQLGNLAGFDPARDAAPAHFTALEKWVLHRLNALVAEVTAAFAAYDFHLGVKAIDHFVSVTLSKQYHDILKDRLYTMGTAHPLRRSSQTAIHLMLGTLMRVLAPILPFTSDEAWSFARSGTEFGATSVHLEDWPAIPPSWLQPQLDAVFAGLLMVRAKVNEAIEPLRAEGRIGKSLDASVTIQVPDGDPVREALLSQRDSLAEIFIVSEARVEAPAEPGDPFGVQARPCSEAGLVRCPRCWRWVPALVPSKIAEVCPRCAEALGS